MHTSSLHHDPCMSCQSTELHLQQNTLSHMENKLQLSLKFGHRKSPNQEAHLQTLKNYLPKVVQKQHVELANLKMS